MNDTRFTRCIAAFDALNAQDPNVIPINGADLPKELVYAHRMTDMLHRYAPEASESLQLAARCQHIQRWKSPRSDFPMTKPGYMQWRHQLKQFHAQVASQVLAEHGYEAELIDAVCVLLKKEQLTTNADMQTLEDVIVLVFLENDLGDFVQNHRDYTEEKFIAILRKSYFKMTEKGRAGRAELDYDSS